MNIKWAPLTLVVVSSLSHGTEAFRENFSEGLAPERWKVSTWTAPKDSPYNRASFSKDHVEIRDGVLRLKLTQTRNEDGSVTSVGGEIRSVQTFGYGTYTFSMKASSTSPDQVGVGKPVSGTISGAFVFAEKSTTEIDIEVEGLEERNNLTQTSSWVDETAPETFKIPPENGKLPHEKWFDYKIVWAPGKVQFYRDGKLISTHTKIVPTLPGEVLFNHWGTNDVKWGGMGTPGVDRYMFVKNFAFTPLK